MFLSKLFKVYLILSLFLIILYKCHIYIYRLVLASPFMCMTVLLTCMPVDYMHEVPAEARRG